jgi:hypothetical protein
MAKGGVDNSGRAKDTILCGLGKFGQHIEVGFFWRFILQTRTRFLRVVPTKVFGIVRTSSADVVIGFEIDPLILRVVVINRMA